ncbi:MAG: LLM class F420-dependent oxidoreductase [Alphaproteobacteria bacterium]|nr:LLM class F420-dependent oxidoreductase [Alphaproteobacteria bacterium]
MKLGLVLGYSGAGMKLDIELVKEAESLGFSSVWTSEAYGSDAISPAAWVLAQTSRIDVGTAIIQIPARTPACAAMTAMTLHALSGGRFILGVGPSGPQVVEGWHGVPYGKPLARTREYIAIVRKVLARQEPLTHDGEHYQIPYRGPGASGLGKPLKSIMHGDPRLRIYTATIAPKGIETGAEVADGMFPFIMNPERFDLMEAPLKAGFAKAGGGKGLDRFAICPFVQVRLEADLAKARIGVKEHLALYIGGMGAREKNFYNDQAKRLGYEGAAADIQNHFLAGRRAEAVAAVPDKLVDEVALVGPKERIVERMARWKAAAAKRHVDTLLMAGGTRESLRVLAEAAL